jgi:hypothetical protein
VTVPHGHGSRVAAQLDPGSTRTGPVPATRPSPKARAHWRIPTLSATAVKFRAHNSESVRAGRADRLTR